MKVATAYEGTFDCRGEGRLPVPSWPGRWVSKTGRGSISYHDVLRPRILPAKRWALR